MRSTSCRPTTSPQRRAQRVDVQPAGQPQRRSGCCRSRCGPSSWPRNHKPLLRERQRHPLRPLHRHQRGPGRVRTRPAGPPARATVGASNSARIGTSTPNTDADPADQPRRQQRMPAQLEEAVVDPDTRQRPAPRANTAAQDLLPQRHRADGRRHHADESGRGQRLAVQLAVHRQRQRVQHHERRRHHVLRQHSSRMTGPHARRHPASSGALGRGPHRRPDACHRAGPHARPPPPGPPAHAPDSTASTSPGSIRKPRIFTWSSARPRYSSSPSARPPRQIPGAVHPLTRHRTDTPRTAPPSNPARPRYPRASPAPAMYNSPATPTGTGSQRTIQHIHPRVRDRPTDRHHLTNTPTNVTSNTRTPTVVSVGPYSFTTDRPRARTNHAAHISTGNTSPPPTHHSPRNPQPTPHRNQRRQQQPNAPASPSPTRTRPTPNHPQPTPTDTTIRTDHHQPNPTNNGTNNSGTATSNANDELQRTHPHPTHPIRPAATPNNSPNPRCVTATPFGRPVDPDV